MGKLGINPFMDVYLCVRDQHAPGMLLLSAAVAMLAAITAVLALRRSRVETRREARARRYAWAATGGLALGIGGWAAHHVALLG